MQVDPVVLAAHALHTSPGTYAVLLGSGFSSAAGIPTGWDITLGLARRVASIDDAAPDDPVEWYRCRFGTDPDYSRLLETLGATPPARQAILHKFIEPNAEYRAKGLRVPTPAHKAVARLVASGHIRVILTTNFDQLIETALHDVGVSFERIATDDALAGARPIGQAPCHVIKLHGDYRDSRIRNTEAELAEYSDAFNGLLDRVLDEYGLIICGWSATWDLALRDAISRQPNRRYTTWWVDIGELSNEAAELAVARQASVIQADADTFFLDLSSKVAALTDADRPHPISVTTAVAELKRFLPDPVHRIHLRDLICGEARRLQSACDDTNFPLRPDLDEGRMRARVVAYEGQTKLLETLFGIGCAWDTSSRPFVEALEIVADISHMAGGYDDLLKLRRYPALRCLYVGGLAAVYHQRWAMLRALTSDATTTHRYGKTVPMSIALNYWLIFNNFNRGNWLPGQERNYIPVSSHLFKTLRATLYDTIPVDKGYETVFDRFEYLLGLIIEDTRQQPEYTDTPSPPVGYFNRNQYSTSGPTQWEQIKSEAEQAGADWGPIRAGLFGGSFQRFAIAEEAYSQQVLSSLQRRR